MAKHIGKRVNLKAQHATVIKKKAIATPWLKNAMKSIGSASMSVFSDIAPNIHDVTTTSAKSIQEISRMVRGNGSQNTTVTNALKNNKYIKAGQDVFKNTIADLKSGNFNNTDRETEAFMGDLDDFDGGTLFGDWDIDGEGADAGANIQINNINQSDAGFSLVREDLRDISVAQLKGQKAHMDAMIAVSSAGMMQSQQIGNQIIGHLDNISANLTSLVQFNSETMLNYIQASTAYMEKMGSQMEEMSSSSEKIDPHSVYRDKDGGFNTFSYASLVKQNLKSTFKNTDIGFVNDLLSDETLKMMTANPLGFVTKFAIEQVTPKMWKNTLTALDESLAGFMPTILARVAEMADTKEVGLSGTVKRYLGQIFGVKNSRKKEFDLENKITRDATPFDKMTHHTINEVIPKYLRESTAYLRYLVESTGGDTRSVTRSAEAFDMKRGRYRSVREIEQDVYGDIRNAGIDALDRSKFGSRLRSQRTKMTYKNSDKLDENSAAAYDQVLNSFFEELEKHGKYLDITNFDKDSDLSKILDRVKGSKGVKTVLKQALKDTVADNVLAMNANAALQQAIHSRSSLIKSMEEDPSSYNLWTATSGKTNKIDNDVAEVMKGTFGDPETSKKQGTIGDILADIRFLLNRGINVRTIGHGKFDSIDKVQKTSLVERTKTKISTAIDEKNAAISDDMTEEEAQKLLSKESIYETTTEETGTTVKRLQSAMSALAFGRGRMAYEEIASIFSDQVSKITQVLDRDFWKPMKESIFGSKDEAGYSRNGIFSGAQNRMMDMYKSFTRQFNGKGYVDSLGNKVDDVKEGEETVVGSIKKFFSDTKNSFLNYAFGEKDKNTGKRGKGHGFIGFATNSLREGFEGWKEVIFGPDDPNADKKTLEDLKKAVSDALPHAITGGLGGAAFGTLAGGSILGTLVGGPVGGALFGAAGGILSRNEKFQDWLFGEKDPDGNRLGGLISAKVQKAVKENKEVIVGGATLGLMKNIVFGKTGGMLGALVGGPLAGAVIGGSLGFLSKTEMWDTFLHGKEGSWQKGIIPMFNSIFKKGDGSGDTSGSKLLGMAGIGTLGGAMTGALVGKMGLLGAAMTPFGPIGGAVAGLALSMKASKKGFHEYLFGSDVFDEDGNVVGKKIGLLGKFGNMLDAEVFTPLKFGAQDFLEDTRNFLIDKIMAPVEFAIEPFAQAMQNMAESLKNRIDAFTKKVGDTIQKHVIDPIVTVVRKYIVTPLRTAFSVFFKGFTGIAKTLISTPFSALAVATNFMNARDKSYSRKKVMQENRERGVDGFLDNLAIRLHFGNKRDEANHRYYDSENWEDRQTLYEEEKKNRLAETKENKRRRKDIKYNRQMIERATGGELVADTEENRIIAQERFNSERWKNGRLLGRLPKNLKFRGDPTEQAKVRKEEAFAKDPIKASGDPKAETTSRILGVAMQILNVMTGKSPEGRKEKDENTGNPVNGANLGASKTFVNKQSFDEIYQSLMEEGYDPATAYQMAQAQMNAGKASTSTGGTQGKQSVAATLDDMLTGARNSIRRSGKAVKGKINSLKDFMQNHNIPGFAEGGTSEGGFAVVGEDGPEAMNIPKGAQIYSKNNPIPVIIQNLTKMAADKIENAASGFSFKKDDSVIQDDASAEYQEQVKKGSYDTKMKEKKRQEEEEKKITLFQSISNKITDLKDENNKHHKLWSFIFSKKGLVTGALLLALPKLLGILGKINLQDVINAIKGIAINIKNIFGKIGNFIGGHIDQTIEDTKFQQENLENDETPGQRLESNAEDLAELAKTGDLGEWIAPDGEWNHMSGAKTQVAVHAGRGIAKVAGAGFKILKAGAGAIKSGVGGIVSGVTRGVAGTKAGIQNTVGARRAFKELGGGSVKRGKALYNETSASLKAAGMGDLVDDTLGFTFKPTTTDDVLRAGANKSGGVIKAVKGAMTTLIGKVGEVVAKYGGKLGKKLVSLTDDVVKMCQKHFARIGNKITALLGGTAAVASTGVGLVALALNEVTWITVGAINGLSGAARLFYVNEDQVDPLMVAISGGVGALRGSTPGAILDIINELAVDVMGLDVIHQVALFAYHVIVTVMGESEKYDKLIQGKDEFKNEYLEAKEKELKTQYNDYLAVNGKTENDMSYTDYVAKVEAGEITARSTSFANYNQQQHKTLGNKIFDGAKKVLGKPLGNAKKFLFGSKEEHYIDKDGRKWVPSENGMYKVYDKEGTYLGEQFEGEIPEDATLHTKETKGALKKIGGGIKNAIGTVAGGVVDFVKDAKDAAVSLPKGVAKIIANYKNKEVDFMTYMKDDVTNLGKDNMFNGLVTAGMGITKVWMLPKLILSGIIGKIGKNLGESFKGMAEATTNLGDTYVTNRNNLDTLSKSGDITGFLKYSIHSNEDTSDSIGHLTPVLTLGYKVMATPMALIRFLGSGITKAVENENSPIAKILPEFNEKHSAMITALKSGDMKAFNSVKIKSETEGSLGWLNTAVVGIEKHVLATPMAVSAAGHVIGGAIGTVVGKAKDYGTMMKKYVDEVMKYTDPNKDLSGLNTLKFDTDTSDPVSNITGAIMNEVLYTYVKFVRNTKLVGTTISNAVGTAKNWVVDTGTNVLNKGGEIVNNVMTGIMDMGRGGKGGRGGRGTNDTQIDTPYYSQNDPRWKGTMYGDETMGQAGCGPSAFAMAASAVGGRSGISPIDAAVYAQKKGFRDQTGTNWNFVDSAARDFNIGADRQYNPDPQFITSEIKQGNPVILSGVGGSGTPYTKQGHYVVATGTDSNGNVIVKDPRGQNYSGKYPLGTVANNARVAWGLKGGKGGRGRIGGGYGGGRGNKLEEAREAVVKTMIALTGKLNYTQDTSKRTKVMNALSSGSGSGDCSSTCYHIYKTCTGIDIGGSTGVQIGKANGTDVDNTAGCPNENNLLPGDLLYFRGKTGGVGHVEMYIGNGKIMGHGGPNWNDMGPTVKDMKDYCKSRASNNRGYMKTRRWIKDGSVANVTLPDAAANASIFSSLGTASSGALGVLGTIGSFFTQFASKALHGLFTGEWDTEYKWDDETSDVGSGTDTGSVDTIVDPNNMEKSTYQFLTANGFTPASAAGVMGNVYQESKFKPAMLQNGKGPAAGLFQWENYTKKSDRWATLNSYAQARGKDWTDPETQLNFALKEMKEGNWMWAKPSPKAEGATVKSFNEFMNMSDPAKAAEAFSNHFERPGKPAMAVRREMAQKYFASIAELSSALGMTDSDNSNGLTGTSASKKKISVVLPSSVKVTNKGATTGNTQSLYQGTETRGSNHSSGARGGFGGEEGDDGFDITDPTYAFQNPFPFGDEPGGYGATYKSKNLTSSYHNDSVKRYVGGGRGLSDNQDLMQAMIGILERIANATVSSDAKLNLLKDISGTSNRVNVTNMSVNGDGKNGNVVMVTSGEQLVAPGPSKSAQTANKIASGF